MTLQRSYHLVQNINLIQDRPVPTGLPDLMDTVQDIQQLQQELNDIPHSIYHMVGPQAQQTLDSLLCTYAKAMKQCIMGGYNG